MNYNELVAYCNILRGGNKFSQNAQLLKVRDAWHKFYKGRDSLDVAADKVARELKLGKYRLYLPEPIEYEEILASQELMK
jgi:hypothetical protein